MNRIDPRNVRLNDVFFAVVIATAAACTGWIAMAGAHAESVTVASAAPAPVQLQRVVVVARRNAPEAVARIPSRDSDV